MAGGGYFKAEDVRAAARGRWVDVLARCGVDTSRLENRHGPCPGCGGRDRFRWDDKDGEGTWLCSQGGGGTISGDGINLLEHVTGKEWKECVNLVGELLLGDAGRQGGGRGGAGGDWNAGVARMPRREEWIPEFDIEKLRGAVRSVPEGITAEWFMARSAIDPRGVTPGEFLERVFRPGEFAMVFTVYKGPGDFLWAVGKRGYRLAHERGVRPVPSDLPKGAADGMWFLSNPVDGRWHPNPRQQGKFSRRSAESVTAWRYLVLECDEEKTLKRKSAALRDVQAKGLGGSLAVDFLTDATGRKRWAEEMAERPESWGYYITAYLEQAKEVPGLWFRFLARLPMPVVAIYSSGGESWHALVRVDMPDKPSFDTLLRDDAKRVLPVFGADPGAMTPVRLTRLPGTMRGTREQRLIYLNPEAGRERIGELVERRVIA